jgi:hypothetical protein
MSKLRQPWNMPRRVAILLTHRQNPNLFKQLERGHPARRLPIQRQPYASPLGQARPPSLSTGSLMADCQADRGQQVGRHLWAVISRYRDLEEDLDQASTKTETGNQKTLHSITNLIDFLSLFPHSCIA